MSLYILVLVYLPVCDQQYRAPRTSIIHGSSSANIRNIIVLRDSARVRILILVVISSTEPRAQAVSTAAAAMQTSEMFVVLAAFEALHSLILHDESSICNTGTRDFTGTYCRIMTVSAPFTCRFDEILLFFHLVSCRVRMIAFLRACVLACLADLPPGSACGQATRWL